MTYVAVVETHEFTRRAKALISDDEKTSLIDYLATHPDAGVLLGGGVRKLRLARPGGGKSGGYRVIHYYREETGMPLFLITIFAKSRQENLTTEQANTVVQAAETMARTYRRTL